MDGTRILTLGLGLGAPLRIFWNHQRQGAEQLWSDMLTESYAVGDRAVQCLVGGDEQLISSYLTLVHAATPTRALLSP